MRFVDLRISGFGKFHNLAMEFGPGVNVIYGRNEAGKSTLHSFLRAMLYGVNTKERDRQGYIAEKNRYQPWGGGPMEGSVELIWKGQSITLRRSASDTFDMTSPLLSSGMASLAGVTGGGEGGDALVYRA